MRTAIARRYLAEFTPLARDGRLVLPAAGEGDDHAWHLFVIRIAHGGRAGADEALPGVAGLPRALRPLASARARAIESLRSAGVGASVHFIPLHLHPLYRNMGYSPGEFPVAERAYAGAISLPIWPGMSEAQIARVVAAVQGALA